MRNVSFVVSRDWILKRQYVGIFLMVIGSILFIDEIGFWLTGIPVGWLLGDWSALHIDPFHHWMWGILCFFGGLGIIVAVELYARGITAFVNNEYKSRYSRAPIQIPHSHTYWFYHTVCYLDKETKIHTRIRHLFLIRYYKIRLWVLKVLMNRYRTLFNECM